MGGFLFALAIIFLIIRALKEVTEKPYPPDAFCNHKLYWQDQCKVNNGEMSKKEFEKNIQNGKYR